MKNLVRKLILIIMSIILILSIASTIIISANLLAKHKKEQLWAETNKIKIGEEEIFYVDLTKRAEDYEKINQQKENEQLSTKTNIDANVDNTIANDSYSTKTILVKSSNIEKIKNSDNIESIVKISDNLYTVHYTNSEDAESAYNVLKKDEVIENVVKDYKVSILENETSDVNVEALDATKGKEAWGIYDTGLVKYKYMLNQRNANQDIKVAVLDTGVRTTHEVFKNVNNGDRLDLTDSYNYISKNKNIADDNGHGTMVAGIIAEGTSNNVKIVPVKTLDDKGEGGLIAVLEAMKALSNKVDVINLSLGIDEAEIDANSKKYFDEFIKSIYDSGTMIVCASGNKGEENVYYPACSNYTIAVGAVDSNKQISSFSNFGDTLDFTAPGKGLTLPYYTGDNLYNEDIVNVNIKNSGTSFASPFVTSAIAMIKTENKNYTSEQVKNILIQNAEDLGTKGKDKYFGYGFINFDIGKFSKPLIVSSKITTSGENSISITVQAIGGNRITNWSYSNTNVIPNDWRAYSNGSTTVSATLSAYNDKDYYIWFKDEKGNVTGQKVFTAKNSPAPSTNTTTNNTTANTSTNTTIDNTTNNNTTTNTSSNSTTNTSTESGTETADIIYGDLNKNKKIDIGDLLKLKRHIAQANDKSVAQKHPNWKLSSSEITIGDVNKNGRIDIGDILKIQRYIAAQNSAEVKAKHPDWAKLTW